MKQEQQQQAQHLYFQTDLTKTEIANFLGISRSSLHSWIRENEWDRIKKSGQHMPCLLAENCYFIMAKLQENILSELRMMRPVTPEEVNMINKLSITISRLKNRSTLNENLEMMAHFRDYVQQEDAGMVEAIQPIINGFIKSRASVQTWKFMPSKFNDQGFIPATPSVEYKDTESESFQRKKLAEEQLDLADIMAWNDNPPTNSAPFGEHHVPTEGKVNPDSSSGRAGVGTAGNGSEVPLTPSERVRYEALLKHHAEKEEEENARRQHLPEAEESIKDHQQQKPMAATPAAPQPKPAAAQTHIHPPKGKGFNRAWRRRMSAA